MPATQIYEFGPFRLDAAKRLLLRNGEAVALTPKVFDILLALVENHDRLLGKDELLRLVWPNTVVEERNLTVNISTLRKALGERTMDHRYVVTVPGRGYRFAANVQEVQDLHPRSEEKQTDAVAGEKVLETSAKRGSNKSVVRLSVVMITLALAVLLFTYLTRVQSKQGQALKHIGPATQIRSMAVLPFKPLAPDSRDEALEMGIADTLITRLSNLRQIFVRPMSAVRRYAGPEQDPIAAGREQGVDVVLDGSIQKAGDRVRVTVRLMSTADGQQLWDDKLDEKFTDIFSVQDSISERVAEVLAVKLTGEEQKQLTKRYTEKAESLQFYLRGRYYRNKRTPDWVRKAVGEFQQAIDRDPNYALSYVGLADSYSYLAYYGWMPADEALPKARSAVDRALQLDDSLAEAHASAAFIHQQLWEWAETEREYKRAISLNPNYSTAHHWFSDYLKLRRQFDDALREMRLAQELDPVSLIINTSLAEILILNKDFDSAIDQLHKVIELEPSFPNAHNLLACAYFERGRYKEALTEQQKAVELSERRSGYLSLLGCYYAATGKRGEAWRILKELEERYAKQEASGQSIAWLNIALGDKDKALAWLEKDFQQRRPSLPEIADWCWEDLNSDPRYHDLLRRIGLNL